MTKTEKTAITDWFTALYTFGISGEKKREDSLITLRTLSQDGWLDRLASTKQDTFERHFAEAITQIAVMPVEKLYYRFLTAYRRLGSAYETDPSLFWTMTALVAAWPLLSRCLQSKCSEMES